MNIQTNSEVGNLIRRMERDYTSGVPVKISEHVDYDMYGDLNRIDAYANSKHISGEKDSRGRDKPFFNITQSVINIWYRATDIDRKHIRVYSNKVSNYIASFIATIYLQDWFNKTKFGAFLNKWGRMLAKYGSTILKFVEKDGQLYPIVVDWHKVICDPIDFYNNPVIEVLDLTPSQLRQRGYDKDVVEQLIDGAKSTRETLKDEKKDDRFGYIRVYEVHGELPLSYLTDDENDATTYQQMMIVYSFLKNTDGDNEDYYLYRGKEAKTPYMLTHLIEEDGQTLSIGAVRQLFESQWMVNHSMKAIKDQLDLASKLLFQTADENYLGKNALDAVETGDFMIHEVNKPVTQLANNSHDIASLQNFKSEWQIIGNEQVGASDAMRGVQPKSGTAWRQTEAILQENHSLFEIMTENKGLYIEDMLRDYILPFVKKNLNNKEEIVAMLDAHNLKKIDSMYIKAKASEEIERKAKENIKQSLLQGEVPEFIDTDTQGLEDKLRNELSKFENERHIVPSEISEKSWKEIFKDLEWEVEADITGESHDLQAHLQTLNTLYINMLNSGQIKDAQKVLQKILELTGAFSPIELATVEAIPPQMNQQPVPTETT